MITLEFFKYTFFSVIIVSWCVTLFGIFKIRELSKALVVFVIVRAVSSAGDLCSLLLVQVFKTNPNYAGVGYAILSTPVTFYFYFLILGKPKLKSTFLILCLFILVFYVINLLFFQKGGINSYTYLLDSLSKLILGISYYYSMLDDLPEEGVKSLFWINTGQVLYSSGVLFIWILTDYLVKVMNDNLILYLSFHNSLAIISNIFFFVGIWLGARRSPEVASPENP